MEIPRGDSRVACEEQAEKLIKNAQIKSWPVRVDQIAKQRGIRIRYVPLDDELSGMCFYKKGIAFVGVNALHALNRQRFTIAHEIGHIILHRHELQNNSAHVDKTITMLRRDGATARGTVKIEIQANQFAAALLMPKTLIHEYMNYQDLDYGVIQDEDAINEMAKAFVVSSTAMAIRIGNLSNSYLP